MEQIGAKELVSKGMLALPAPFVFSDEEIRGGIGLDIAGIYLFETDKGHEPLYVGVSSNVGRRIYQHLTNRGNPDLYNYMQKHRARLTVYPEDNAGYQEFYESYLILLQNPRYNVSKIQRCKI